LQDIPAQPIFDLDEPVGKDDEVVDRDAEIENQHTEDSGQLMDAEMVCYAVFNPVVPTCLAVSWHL
jgi:hypothetical protein